MSLYESITTSMASFAYRQDKKLSRNKVVINLCIRVLFAEFVVKSRAKYMYANCHIGVAVVIPSVA